MSNKFVKGWSSSTHYTYDVSDLVTKDGNVSKVVDLILYIESHIQEIYTTIKPERYNQTVNRYSVPLAVNQQRLLKELSLLPPFDRTYDRVRNLFNKYYQTELQLNGGHAVSAWKYRAVNYGKFFALGEFKKSIPVVEFRIADLVGPENILATGDFYSRLVEFGSRASSQPFENKLPSFQSQAQMDTFVKSISATRYQMFLKEIGMKSKDLPKKVHDFSKSVCTAVFM